MSSFHFSPRPNRAADIRWQPWDDAAFDRARAEGKPILLAISAVWCHWCHVMDETTYSDADVIATINDRFVPVRVDNDQRPDINARYNQGCWPTTAILTSDGEILKGATYVPPEPMHRLLTQIDALYAEPERRAAIAEQIASRKSHRAAAAAHGDARIPLDVPARIYAFLDANFDEDFGGFGTEPKFPQTPGLHFLLDWWARYRDERTQVMLSKTLHAMSSGGMYDAVEGGFFRYSTTQDFSVPHFEKMLEDLSGLMLACARASAMFGDRELARVAIDVRGYLDRTLWNAEVGAYGGSQDADEAYYGRDAAGRRASPKPYVDPVVYTSWNAEAARALIVGGPLVASAGAEPLAWTRRGIAVLDTLWSKLLVDGLMCRFFDGQPKVRGLLGDQAWSAWAAIAAHQGTGDTLWLDRARSLVDAAGELYDEATGRYLDRIADTAAPGLLAERSGPLDENSVMARALLDLAWLCDDERYRRRAESVLGSLGELYRRYGMHAAGYGSAVLDAVAPPLDVKIGGTGDRALALRDAARACAAPPLRIAADPENTQAAAALCRADACFARARTPSELLDALSHVPAFA